MPQAATPDRSLCSVTEAFCSRPSDLTAASVTKIIDGDTLDVRVDDREERVRIFGIDTPERGDRCFSEAAQALESMAGASVLLRADARERDRGGRLLRYVYTSDGVSIDASMISAGMALAWTQDGALRDPLVALEAQARDLRRGCLWGG
jgi:micrococcal nuclease